MASTADIRQLECIIDEYQDRLFAFAFYQTGDYNVAQDIVQDVFFNLYVKPRSIDKVGLRQFLFTSVYYGCMNHRRQQQRHPVVPLTQAHHITDADENMREYLRIEEMLSILPDNQAIIVKMHFADDLSFVDIAAILGLSPNTIKSRFRYAISKLRTHFKDLDIENEDVQ